MPIAQSLAAYRLARHTRSYAGYLRDRAGESRTTLVSSRRAVTRSRALLSRTSRGRRPVDVHDAVRTDTAATPPNLWDYG